MFSPTKLFKKIGPGVITGASDDDPSGIATYSQTGAQFGYGLLWLSLFSIPLMMAVQELSARIGMTSGRGLMTVFKRHSSQPVIISLSALLLIANVVNIGADLGAMAAATRLVLPGSTWLYLILYAAIIIALEVLVSYQKYVNVLRWLTMALFSYVIASFFIHVPWSTALFHTFVPSLTFNRDTIFVIVAILGTTISPYLFFWQASEEVEEAIEQDRIHRPSELATTKEIRAMRADVGSGMILSNVVMFFIIVTTAATLHANGITNITSAAQAAEALKPFAGNASFLLFTIGILGTGLLAIPVLAGSASYAIAEVFGWREGLGQTFRQAPQFYATMGVAVVIGLLMNGLGLSPVTLLIIAAVVNGLVAPFMLWHIVRLGDRTDVVGEHTSPPLIRIGGWVTFGIMTLAGVLLLIGAVV